MSRTKTISILFFFFIGIYLQNIKAQGLNINGDTIFVNTDAEIQIIFPTQPTNFKTIPANTQYRIWNAGKGINLIPSAEDFSPATLLVSEAQRNHKFILIFKPEINYNEAKLYYDYSTEKKLAQHIRKTGAGNSVRQEKTVANNETKPDNKRKKTFGNKQQEDSSLNSYYVLLAQGDIDLKQQNFKSAELNFSKAHALRPKDKIPVERLEEMRIQLAAKEILTQQENNTKYISLTAEAKDNLDKKNYTGAQKAYKLALEVKPGDLYATQQLQTINNILTKADLQNEKATKDINNTNNTETGKELNPKQLTDENNYNTAIKAADILFKAGDYDKAKIEYNKASGFINRNYPKDQINKINKILNDQLVQAYLQKMKPAPKQDTASEIYTKNDVVLTPAEIKKQYNSLLARGKSSLNDKDYITAKAFYEEAISLMPLAEEPKTQINIINNKLEELAIDTQINNYYDSSIALADSQVIAKEYESAIATYKDASILKPLESYPKKQLQYIQSELALIKKKKKEEEERRYSSALMRADKAVADKKYDDAKSAYNEALSIHPENEYAKKRLEIVSYQLEKEKLKN